MQVSVETTEGLGRRMTVELPKDRLDSEVQSRLQRLTRTVDIKGFRPGKVPMKIVQKRYGADVRNEVLNELLQSSFSDALRQENLHPAYEPTIEESSLEAQDSFKYTAVFEVMPEIQLADLADTTFEIPTAPIEDGDVDKMIDKLLTQTADWKEVDREAADGDRVRVDFTGTLNGEEFAGGKGDNLPITLGSGSMIEGFESGIVGAKAGESRTLNLSFPEDYHHNDVAGKEVQFAVTVNLIEESVPAELNDELFQRFGITEGGLDAFRAAIRDNMAREMQNNVDTRMKQAVMDKMLESNDFDVPNGLIEREAQALVEQTKQNMQQSNPDSPVDLDHKVFMEQAERRVRLGMLIMETAKQRGVTASHEAITAEISRIASTYQDPTGVVEYFTKNQERLAEVENLVLEKEVVKWVLENAKQEETSVSFEELMGQQPA